MPAQHSPYVDPLAAGCLVDGHHLAEEVERATNGWQVPEVEVRVPDGCALEVSHQLKAPVEVVRDAEGQ